LLTPKILDFNPVTNLLNRKKSNRESRQLLKPKRHNSKAAIKSVKENETTVVEIVIANESHATAINLAVTPQPKRVRGHHRPQSMRSKSHRATMTLGAGLAPGPDHARDTKINTEAETDPPRVKLNLAINTNQKVWISKTTR
jgi:D-aminopeptidase